MSTKNTNPQMNFTDANGEMIGTSFKWPKRKPKEFPELWWDRLKACLAAHLPDKKSKEGLRLGALISLMDTDNFKVNPIEAASAIWWLGYEMRLELCGRYDAKADWFIYNRARQGMVVEQPK